MSDIVTNEERDYISFTFYMYSVPLDEETFLSLDEAITFINDNNLSDDVEISENMYGVIISFYNSIGANGNYMIPQLSALIKEDEEGIWSQYKTFIEKYFLPKAEEEYVETSYSISSYLDRKLRERESDKSSTK